MNNFNDFQKDVFYELMEIAPKFRKSYILKTYGFQPIFNKNSFIPTKEIIDKIISIEMKNKFK